MPNTSPTDSVIYKILTPDEWAQLSRDGETLGSPLDHKDGFIHFSTRGQLRGTLDKHFAGAGLLVLAAITLDTLSGNDVRWEAARNGDLFPHLYGALSQSAVFEHWLLHETDEGGYALPGELGTKS